MNPRREFLRLSAAGAVLGLAAPAGLGSLADAASAPAGSDRERWCALARRVAGPVLTHLAARMLKASMPVESHRNSCARPSYTHLEAFGRTLAGLAPWLELADDGSPEDQERARWARLARQGIAAATDPASPDFMTPDRGERAVRGSLYLCSTAFLPLGLPVNHSFWSAPPEQSTWEKAWSGQAVPLDRALKEIT